MDMANTCARGTHHNKSHVMRMRNGCVLCVRVLACARDVSTYFRQAIFINSPRSHPLHGFLGKTEKGTKPTAPKCEQSQTTTTAAASGACAHKWNGRPPYGFHTTTAGTNGRRLALRSRALAHVHLRSSHSTAERWLPNFRNIILV